MRKIFLPAFMTLVAFSGLMAEPARAEIVGDGAYQIYLWPKWQKGFDFGARAMGRFGKGSNINAPAGDILATGSYHIWYQHLVGLHAGVGYGIANSTLMYGAGMKINMLELIEDPDHEMLIRGFQRGLLAPLLKNFMVFLGVDFMHFNFKRPEGQGLDYATSQWRVMPAAGAQWYFYFSQGLAGRFYLETSLYYMQVNQSHYVLPQLSLGAELL